MTKLKRVRCEACGKKHDPMKGRMYEGAGPKFDRLYERGAPCALRCTCGHVQTYVVPRQEPHITVLPATVYRVQVAGRTVAQFSREEHAKRFAKSLKTA